MSPGAHDPTQTYGSPAVKEARSIGNQSDLFQSEISPYSVHPRQQHHPQPYTLQHPIAEIRKRLARKVSVFSLRSKKKGSQLREAETPETKNRAIACWEKELPEPPSSSVCSSPFAGDIDRSRWDIDSSRNTVTLSSRDRPASDFTNLDSFPAPPKSTQGIQAQRPAKAPVNPSVTPNSALETLQESIRLRQRLLVQEGYIQRSRNTEHTFVKMAAENAAPPVPYARLQELTISVCARCRDL